MNGKRGKQKMPAVPFMCRMTRGRKAARPAETGRKTVNAEKGMPAGTGLNTVKTEKMIRRGSGQITVKAEKRVAAERKRTGIR